MDAGRKPAHGGERVLDVARNVLAVQHDRPVRAQSEMKRRPVLGGVDALTREHAPRPPLDPALAGEREEQSHRLFGDELLGIVEQHSVGREGELVVSPGIACEQLAQMQSGDCALVLGELLPGRKGGAGGWHYDRIAVL